MEDFIMARAGILVVLAGLAMPLSGCGTLSDAFCGPIDNHLYYRGLRFDVRCACEGKVVMLLDAPVSAVVDTACVPLVFYYDRAGRAERAKQAPPHEPQGVLHQDDDPPPRPQ